MKICPKCGFKFENYASYCNFCDLSLDRVKQCNSSELTDDEKSNSNSVSKPKGLQSTGEGLMAFSLLTLIPMYEDPSSKEVSDMLFWFSIPIFILGFFLFIIGLIINKKK